MCSDSSAAINESIEAGAPDKTAITTAMIEAGVLAYLSYDPRFEDVKDVVPRVYIAMMKEAKRMELAE
jgi:hypothetical protein